MTEIILFEDWTASRIEELEAELERLQERAQRAEALAAYTEWYESILRGDGYTFSANEDGELVNTHNPIRALRAKIGNLRGALQAALLPLERAADALASPAWPEEAAALVEEALVAIREELEE